MSRLDGIEDTLNPKEREHHEHYEPGIVGFDLATVEHLVGRFINNEMKTHYNRLSSEVSYLKEALPTADDEEFKPNAFLDEIIARVDERAPPSRIRGANRLFDPLVQALYENGHNNLHLDFMFLQSKRKEMFPLFSRFGDNLQGTHNRPLRVTYRARTDEFGQWARFCHLELQGECRSGGYGACRSKLTFNGTVNMPGYYAEESIFHLEEVDPYAIHSMDCTYHAKRILKDLPFSHNAWQYFFEQGNTIVYLKDGEWKEVTP